jgi:hypothetical protein
MLQVISLKDRFLVYILYFPSILLMYLDLCEVQSLAGSDRSSSYYILNSKGIQTATKGQETLERSANEIWAPAKVLAFMASKRADLVVLGTNL